MSPLSVITPPRQSTMARARDAANAVVDMNMLRKCIALTLKVFISPVSSSNSRSILSSITRVFIVLAPVMPSLKAEVIRELCSRTLR